MESVKIVACPHPFRSERIELAGDPSRSVDQLIGDLITDGHAPFMPRENFSALVDGTPIDEDKWATTLCDPGEELVIVAHPAGGDGAGARWLRTFVMVAAMAAGQYYVGGWGASVWGVGSKGAILAGSLGGILGGVVGGLIPVPEQESYQPAPSANWTAENGLNPFAPFPRLYGQKVVYPRLVAQPWIEGRGDDAVWHALYAVGMGRIDMDVDTFKFGEVLLSDMSGVVLPPTLPAAGANVEVFEGYSGDPASRTIVPPMAKLVSPDTPLTWDTYTADIVCEDYAKKVVPTIYFKYGLLNPPSDWEHPHWGKCEISVQYRAAGSSDAWVSFPDSPWTKKVNFYLNDAHRVPCVFPSVSAWEIRIKVGPHDGDAYTLTDCIVSQLEYTNYNVDMVPLDNVATIGMSIPTKDLPGDMVPTQFNLVAQGYIEDFSTGDWVSTKGADNCASVYRDILLSAEASMEVSSSLVDDKSLEDWWDKCDDEGFTFNAYITKQRTVPETLALVGAIGRAAYQNNNGYHGVVYAEHKTTASQLITPRNSYGFTGKKAFKLNVPHGVKVRYEDWDMGDAITDRIVYRDGYAETAGGGDATATLFETIDAYGCNDKDLAVKIGTFYINSAMHLDEEFVVNMDVEHMTMARGDMIHLVHDVPSINWGQGRIKSYKMDDATALNLERVTLDNEIYLVADTYVLEIQNVIASGSNGVTNLIGDSSAAEVTIASDGYYSIFTFDDVIVGSNIEPNIGDLVIVRGITESFGEYIVTGITPDENQGARLDLVENKSEVYAACTGRAYSSNVTIPPVLERQPPRTPVILDIRSNEDVLVVEQDGSLGVRIAIAVDYLPDLGDNNMTVFHPAARKVRSQYRAYDATTPGKWISMPDVYGEPETIYFNPVVQGEAYDVRICSISDHHVPTPWVTETNHTVVGKSTPPDAPTDARIENNVLRWAYGTPASDFAGFEVRMHRGSEASWAAAAVLHTNIITENQFALPKPLAQGERTFYVKALDTSGNYSTSSVSVAHTANRTKVDNRDDDLSMDLESDGGSSNDFFLGQPNVAQLQNGTVYGAGGVSDLYADSDGASGYDEMIYEYKYTLMLDAYLATYEIDASQNVDFELLFKPEVTAESWRMEVKYCDDTVDFFTEDGWIPLHGHMPVTGTVGTATAAQFRVRIVVDAQTAPTTQSKITAFNIDLGYPNVLEYGDATITAKDESSITGRTFTFEDSQTYDEVSSVTITPKGTNDAVAATVDQLETTGSPAKYNGFTVNMVDGSKGLVTGDILWKAEVYNKFSKSLE